MKREKSRLQFLLQEQPRSPESGLIQAWFKQQQQEGYTPDLVGGVSVLTFQLANAGAATLTGTGLSVANLTGKLLIVWTVGAIGGGSISCQMQSCTNSGGAGAASAGAAFGTVASTSGTFQLDLESFAAAFCRSVVTIVTGPTPVSVMGLAFTKLV